jgi:uncharacterized membrane protein (UPF0127 family)
MDIKINDNIYKVKLVITGKDIQKGMMGRKFDNTFDGMLFLMKDGPQSFWMKNCITNLDIIFIDKGNITKIHHNCKPCNSDDCENFEGNGDMVLELRGGECKKYGIEEDDSIDILS